MQKWLMKANCCLGLGGEVVAGLRPWVGDGAVGAWGSLAGLDSAGLRMGFKEC